MTEATVNTKAQSGSNASVSPIICLAIAESNKELGNKIPEADNVVFPELQSHILQHTIKNKYQDEESQISKLIKANNFTHTRTHTCNGEKHVFSSSDPLGPESCYKNQNPDIISKDIQKTLYICIKG